MDAQLMTPNSTTHSNEALEGIARQNDVLARGALPEAPMVMQRQVLEGASFSVLGLLGALVPVKGRIARGR
ncbi:hypothetical protein AQS8620_00748 [Aquimixticola soesokkakensis]|uniref:Uncharacterized protein n=1 Tax=Aquimixticola soesokkakensis TaxID=1519096 RepID=A0A1Y5RW27_9RHOB|nr:hypothetical protein [Aquimixticola soesokkakensis]SLN25462.1 hypothetical protein AQS8620_00748 [Aquimixticola soesokkakensis]